MCSKQNGRFKSKHLQYDYKNKWVENINKRISCEWKCKFNDRKCNSSQKCNNDKCRRECKTSKNIMCPKKITFGIPLHVDTKLVNI